MLVFVVDKEKGKERGGKESLPLPHYCTLLQEKRGKKEEKGKGSPAVENGPRGTAVEPDLRRVWKKRRKKEGGRAAGIAERDANGSGSAGDRRRKKEGKKGKGEGRRFASVHGITGRFERLPFLCVAVRPGGGNKKKRKPSFIAIVPASSP